MLAKCANPACGTPFRHLSEGKLFQVEGEDLPRAGRLSLRKRRHYVERYWLCEACAARFTLTFERDRGVVPVPLIRRPPVTVPIRRPAIGSSLAARIA